MSSNSTTGCSGDHAVISVMLPTSEPRSAPRTTFSSSAFSTASRYSRRSWKATARSSVLYPADERHVVGDGLVGGVHALADGDAVDFGEGADHADALVQLDHRDGVGHPVL